MCVVCLGTQPLPEWWQLRRRRRSLKVTHTARRGLRSKMRGERDVLDSCRNDPQHKHIDLRRQHEVARARLVCTLRDDEALFSHLVVLHAMRHIRDCLSFDCSPSSTTHPLPHNLSSCHNLLVSPSIHLFHFLEKQEHRHRSNKKLANLINLWYMRQPCLWTHAIEVIVVQQTAISLTNYLTTWSNDQRKPTDARVCLYKNVLKNAIVETFIKCI